MYGNVNDKKLVSRGILLLFILVYQQEMQQVVWRKGSLFSTCYRVHLLFSHSKFPSSISFMSVSKSLTVSAK